MIPFALRRLALAFFVFLALFSLSRPAYANPALIFRGVARTLFSVAQIPGGMIAGSAQSFPIGTVVGALTGTAKAVGGTLAGAVDIARGGAPYAKYLIFL